MLCVCGCVRERANVKRSSSECVIHSRPCGWCARVPFFASCRRAHEECACRTGNTHFTITTDADWHTQPNHRYVVDGEEQFYSACLGFEPQFVRYYGISRIGSVQWTNCSKFSVSSPLAFVAHSFFVSTFISLLDSFLLCAEFDHFSL